MADTVVVEFVLVRGPTALDRRLRVALPTDGTPVTVGRAAHCGVLLDPTLLFSSQVHCSLFAMRAKTAARPAEASPSAGAAPPALPTDGDGTRGDGTALAMDDAPGNAAVAVLQTTPPPPQQQQQRGSGPAWCVYVTDLCSSNGTFVNGVRISGTDPAPLHHGDVCIFGGMRDVAVGAALPADAYDGPELVQWRVDLRTGAGVAAEDGAFDFTATPLVLPARDTLAAEAHALMTTVQRSLGKAVAAAAFSPLAALTPTPGAASGRASSSGRRSGAHRGGESPHGVPQRLFTSPTTEAKAAPHAAAPEAAAEADEAEARRSPSHHRRSTSPAAPLPDVGVRAASPATDRAAPAVGALPDAVCVPVAPVELPGPVRYDVVRLGNVTFDARSPACAAAAAAAADAAEETNEGAVEEEEEDCAEGAVTGAKRRRAASATSRTPQKRRADPSSRTEGAAPAAAPAASPAVTALLTCTPSHLKWTMTNPNDLLTQQHKQQQQQEEGDGRSGDVRRDASAGEAPSRPPPPPRAFYGMLPVTSIATVVACPARRGLAVELRDGCVLPLVTTAVLSGSAESRWVVWALSTAPCAADVARMAETPSSSRGAARAAKGRGHKASKAAAAAASDATSGSTAETLSTPEARYAAWLNAFTQYYGSLGVPAPVCVDGDAFDVLLAPPSPATPTA